MDHDGIPRKFRLFRTSAQDHALHHYRAGLRLSLSAASGWVSIPAAAFHRKPTAGSRVPGQVCRLNSAPADQMPQQGNSGFLSDARQ